MEDEKPADQVFDTVPEPEAIQSCRKVLSEIESKINSGEIEGLSVYAQMRDGAYLNFQTASPSRHEDAGRILELAILRLGFQNSAAEDD